MDRFDIITTQQLKQMLDDRRLNKTDFILVNSLDEIIFRNSSIPGSINLPWSRVKESASILGEDKDKLIVTYWVGYRWVFAYKTAVAVKGLGFTNIKIYNGGLKDWKKSGYKIDVIDPLPEYEGRFLTVDELLRKLKDADQHEISAQIRLQ